jgi:type IV pilus assembly protein PilQ
MQAAKAATAVPATRPAEGAAEPSASGSRTPVAIRSISVQRGQGTVDVVIDGPSSAHPFQLSHPDRLVLDFNAVLEPSVKSIAAHTKDVLQVRVGRFQSQTTRVVIDLSGPRPFEVLPSANQVIVRIKSDEAAATLLPVKASEPQVSAKVVEAAQPVAAPVQSEETAKLPPPVKSAPASVPAKTAEAAPAKPAKAEEAAVLVPPVHASASLTPSPAPASVVGPVAGPAKPESTAAVSAAQQLSDPKTRAGLAADTMASSRQVGPQFETAQSASANLTSTSKYTGEPISVNLKDVDLKDFFRLIHEISGLNIVLDPNVHGSLTLVLDDVPWDQALDIVLKNNGLDRELQGNVLRIASVETLRKEAVDRRAQAEAVALAVDRQTITRFLSYAKAGQVVPTVKKFLTARGDVIADERTNALIISDIPSVLPTLDRMISQLDKKSQEVEIEVRVVSASRTFTRDLGVQLGFAWQNGVSTVAGSLASAATGTTTGTGTNGVSSGRVPLFSNFPATNPTTGFSFTNITKSYAIDAILTAAENHTLAKVLSRPRVVTQSNVKAEVKQGVKLPVYTSGTANVNASVSYVDAVLRLSVTPQITADNTIFMTVDVENTQPNGTINSNFILTTQQATTQVLVTDGGTVVIGGIIQTTNTVSTSQTPFLGSIPWLGNLFKERAVKTDTEELIFFITPKIIQT